MPESTTDTGSGTEPFVSGGGGGTKWYVPRITSLPQPQAICKSRSVTVTGTLKVYSYRAVLFSFDA